MNNIISPKPMKYLGEVRVKKQEEIAIFKCHVFRQQQLKGSGSEFWRFCFDYVTTSLKGTVETTARFCMPAANQEKGSNYRFSSAATFINM